MVFFLHDKTWPLDLGTGLSEIDVQFPADDGKMSADAFASLLVSFCK